jgi:hypothetical protein
MMRCLKTGFLSHDRKYQAGSRLPGSSSVGVFERRRNWRDNGPAGRELPSESLDDKLIGTRVRLANGSQVWALIGNFNVTNRRATQHFLTLSIERSGKWFYLARYHDIGFPAEGPEALARFLDLHVDDVFPISLDVRRYVRGDPAALTAIVLKEPRERLTREELWALH